MADIMNFMSKRFDANDDCLRKMSNECEEQNAKNDTNFKEIKKLFLLYEGPYEVCLLYTSRCV